MNVSHAPVSNLSAPNEQAERALSALWTRPPGLIGWLCSTNHKDIGRRYVITALIFFVLAGVGVVVVFASEVARQTINRTTERVEERVARRRERAVEADELAADQPDPQSMA